jgi:LPS sulfotransferase NodH
MMKYCILCAAPRSGTMALAEAVATAYQVASPPEIFFNIDPEVGLEALHQDPEDRGNFFLFRSRAAASRPELLFPTPAMRQTLWRLYLDHLADAYSNDGVLMDIKYNSWHHLDGYWRFPTEPPGLVQIVRESRIPVVHLVRRNLFALYCSLRRAELSNIWQKKNGDPSHPQTLAVDLGDCLRWMTDMRNMQEQFAGWFHGHPVHTLTFETLFDQGRFAPHVYDVFTEVFGHSPVRELSTGYTKVLPPLNRVVENADAVLDFFANTDFDDLVRGSLGKPSGQ